MWCLHNHAGVRRLSGSFALPCCIEEGIEGGRELVLSLPKGSCRAARKCSLFFVEVNKKIPEENILNDYI